MARRKTTRKGIKTCFYCGKLIDNIIELTYIGLDRPYIMLPFHKHCHNKINGKKEEKYLRKNEKRILDLYQAIKKKEDKKWNKIGG